MTTFAVGGGTEAVVFAFVVALAALLVLASFTSVPYPIWLVVGGVALGFMPGIPEFELDPDLVFLIALPPLLYSAAFFSSLRELRQNLKAISLLSIGLVIATAFAVAVVGHELIGLSWQAAFVLGAVVSPTDPVAATSIARRLGVHRRVVAIVEGESLVNDATALVAYRAAVAAVLTGSFSVIDAGLEFVLGGVGGAAIGLAAGWVVAKVRRRLDDPPTEIAISLMTGYFAYLPAAAIGASGVIAAVTVGIYMGWRAPELITPTVRLQGFAVWEVLVFVLNAGLFVLLGLQFENVLDTLSGEAAGTLIGYGAAVSGAVILTRILWVFPLTYLPLLIFRRARERETPASWQIPALVSWNGMRGAVSLAAALAIPLETDAGAPFPDRELIIFLTFCVILVTLLVQGLSMPALIRVLDIEDGDEAEREEVKARLHAAESALARIEELLDEDWVNPDTAERMRGLYDYRLRRFNARFGDDSDESDGIEDRSLAYQRLRREALEAERRALVELRNQGVISDEVLRRVERELDLEDARLEI